MKLYQIAVEVCTATSCIALYAFALVFASLPLIGSCRDLDRTGVLGYGNLPAFRGFLSTNHPFFALTYSITQEEYPALKAQLAALEKTGRKYQISFNKPIYYHVENGPDGFSHHFAHSLTQLHSRKFSYNDQSPKGAFGVYSNRYWWISGNTLTFDDERLEREKANGRDLFALTREAEQGVLSLGLDVRNGTLLWDGNLFTAETPGWGKTPKDKRNKRLVQGKLYVTNGFPASVEYRYSIDSWFLVSYDYGVPFTNSDVLGLPFKFKVLQVNPDQSGTVVDNHTVQLISLKLSGEALGSPEPFMRANTNLLIAEKRRDQLNVRYPGAKPGANPISIPIRGEEQGTRSIGVAVLRKILLLLAIIPGAYLLIKVLRKPAKGSRQ